MVMTNLAIAYFNYSDPLAQCGGQVEVIGDKEKLNVEEIKTWLRRSSLKSLFIWGIASGITLFALFYGIAQTPRKEPLTFKSLPWEAQTAVIAASVFIGLYVLWYLLGKLGLQKWCIAVGMWAARTIGVFWFIFWRIYKTVCCCCCAKTSKLGEEWVTPHDYEEMKDENDGDAFVLVGPACCCCCRIKGPEQQPSGIDNVVEMMEMGQEAEDTEDPNEEPNFRRASTRL